MITIWKYQIEPGENRIAIPKGSQVLSVQVQQGMPCIWVKVDTKNKKVERVFCVYGTGHEIFEKENLVYIGTFQIIEEIYLVYHLFEKVLENWNLDGRNN